VLNGGTR